MRSKLAVLFVAVLALASTAFFMPKKANAIAAFAQKYHFSCAVCHINGYGGGASLNPFGRAFQRNGFRLPSTNGTPADATQVAEGLSLPNPWPIPIMIEVNIGYKHVPNENVSNSTDAFSASAQMHTGGAFKLYTPLADTLSWYTGVDYGTSSVSMDNTFGVLDGLGSGFGIPSHLMNLALGYSMNIFNPSPYFGGGSGKLAIGYDGGSSVLSEGAGFQLYGTPGYHLWYMVGVTNGNSAGSQTASNGVKGGVGGTALSTSGNNSMNYNWRLGEFYPTSVGTLELDYYGGTVAQPLTVSNQGTWTNRVVDNGVGIGLSNGIYEVGASLNQISDSNPYANPSRTVAISGVTDTSNGYQYLYLYGDYKFSHFITEEGTYLQVSYAQYDWTHASSEDAFINSVNGTAYGCNAGLYGSPASLGGTCYEGQKDNLTVKADIMLAANAFLSLGYNFSNISEEDAFTTNLEFAF